MASWPDQRAQFVQQFTAISNYVQNQLQTDIQNLSAAMATYVQAGGISNDPPQDPTYATIVAASQNIQTNRANMMALTSAVSSAIRTYASNNDMNGLLAENGLLQQTNQDTEMTRKAAEADAKAAEQRSELLRTREHKVSRHQLFLLGRPLRPASIPYLWALSVLFVGLGLLAAAMAFPSLNLASQFEGMDMRDVLALPAVWGSVLGAALIVILFLSLNAAGVFKSSS